MAAFFAPMAASGGEMMSPRAEKAVAARTPALRAELSAQGLAYGAPLFLRIVKAADIHDPENLGKEGYLDAYIADAAGDFQFFKRWDICTWSGHLGPKRAQGDRQSPEGFYYVTPRQMNPNSSFHLSFDLGYPNAYDRAYGRTGDFLMVHGSCVSVGCYAMTDDSIEEIYTLMYGALSGGQPFVRVHVFPFEMSSENMAHFESHPDAAFWQNLKQGWDAFEMTRRPPNVEVSGQNYVITPE